MAKRQRKPQVFISSDQEILRVPRKRLTELVAFVAEQERAAIRHVDIAVVGREEIASLNRKYLSRRGPTDVLSFGLSGASGEGLCIQLVVSADAAVEQARAHDIGPQKELMLYVVHGLLHQMGYEDKSARAAARMHTREDELLDAFGKRGLRKS
jgi:probable rRNA maturation factor